MPTAQDVLNFANSLLALNIHETPDGSNVAHPITDWAAGYGYSTGDAWCAWTVSYILFHVDPALAAGPPTGYSGDFLSRHLAVSGPAPGAIMVLDNGSGGITDHTGIVASALGASFVCYEGNHSNRYGLVPRHLGDGNTYWFVLPKYSNPTPPKKIEQEDDEMIEASLGKAAIVPSWADGQAMDCYLDFTNQANVVSKVRLSARRDNGDRTDPDFSTAHTFDILEEGTHRIEVGRDLKLLTGVSVKVEVLVGGPVLVVRKQTL